VRLQSSTVCWSDFERGELFGQKVYGNRPVTFDFTGDVANVFLSFTFSRSSRIFADSDYDEF
jgi:hypothetical protein